MMRLLIKSLPFFVLLCVVSRAVDVSVSVNIHSGPGGRNGGPKGGNGRRNNNEHQRQNSSANEQQGNSSAQQLQSNCSLSEGSTTIVYTENGIVNGTQGIYHGNVTTFKGIPYAAPPLAELRWKPPQPVQNWTGALSAQAFGNICPQSGGDSGTQSEDCLTLNVYVPGSTSECKQLPVYFWIYGGRFTGGSSANSYYDGEGLAAKGIVVVTINYRLGPLGFLSLPELTAESGHNASGNYGLMDQIAALKWVQRNIAAFGGNPNRVTIGGQSAGSASVLQLVYSPLAKGLFHGAIAESGARYPRDPNVAGLATSYIRSLAEAEQDGLAYMSDHNVTTLAEMRNLSIDSILDGSTANDAAYYSAVGYPPLFRPVLDGYVMARSYEETLLGGYQSDIPIITGNNKDESGAAVDTDITLEEYKNNSLTVYGNMTDEFLSLYPAYNDVVADNMTNDAARDNSRVGTLFWAALWARNAKSLAFTYYWTHAPPLSSDGGQIGAFHMSEIYYFFNNLYANTARNWTATDYAIADTMSSYLVNFVTNGNPNGGDLPYWPVTNNSTYTMGLGDYWGVVPVADSQAKIDFLRRFYATQRSW